MSLIEGPWERQNSLREAAEKITIVGGALVGLGSILFCIALFWHPSPRRRKRVPDRTEWNLEPSEVTELENTGE